MTELEALTVRAIAESAARAAELGASGEQEAAANALARAERTLGEFSEHRPWHDRAVRLAREAVDGARLVVRGKLGPSLQRDRAARRSVRAAARAKTL